MKTSYFEIKFLFVPLFLVGTLLLTGPAVSNHPLGAQEETEEQTNEQEQQDSDDEEEDRAPSQAESQFERAVEMYENENYEDAIRLFSRLRNYTSQPEIQQRAHFLLAESRYANRDYMAAYSLYQEYLQRYPRGEQLEHVVRMQLEVGFHLMRGEEYRDLLGVSILPAYQMGEDIVRELLSRYPYQEFSDDYQYRLANYFFENGNYEQAASEYEILLNTYPESPWRSNARFLMGQSLLNQINGIAYDTRALEEARNHFQTYLDEYPNGQRVDRVQELLKQTSRQQARKDYETAAYYRRVGKTSGAVFYFKEVIRNYPLTDWATRSMEALEEMDAEISEELHDNFLDARSQESGSEPSE